VSGSPENEQPDAQKKIFATKYAYLNILLSFLVFLEIFFSYLVEKFINE